MIRRRRHADTAIDTMAPRVRQMPRDDTMSVVYEDDAAERHRRERAPR